MRLTNVLRKMSHLRVKNAELDDSVIRVVPEFIDDLGASLAAAASLTIAEAMVDQVSVVPLPPPDNYAVTVIVEEEAVKEAAVTEEAVTEEVVAEEAVTEEAVTEEAVTEEAVTEEVVAEEAVTEEAVTEEAVTEEAVAEEAVAEEAVTEEAVAEKIVARGAVEAVPVDPDCCHYIVFRDFPDQRENGDDSGVTDALWVRMWTGLNEYLLDICCEKKAPDFTAIPVIVEMIHDSLLADNALIRMLFAKKRGDDLTSHMLDMAVVATKMGIVLGYDRDRLRELALCALLHDIGMLRVSPDVVMRESELSKIDLVEIQKHPLYSYEILMESGLSAVIAEVARQVHEREDGSGYPRGLRGGEIHEYASIISLADTYTAMLQPRPQRERKIPFEIVKEIIERGQGQFNRQLMKVLIDEFSIFPVGLYVQLNTGEIAKVKKANKLAPLRPEVMVVTDVRGRRLAEPKEYNLMREPLLTVVDSAFEQEGGFTGKPTKASAGGAA